MIDIVLLGTGNPIPDPRRAGPATLVRAGDVSLLVDCGRGVLQRAAAVGTQANQLAALLLTHLHSDHITDAGDVISTRWLTTTDPSPFVIIGPPRTSEVVSGVLSSLQPDVDYRMAHHVDLAQAPTVDVRELCEGVALELGEVNVLAARTDHRPVEPTVAYRIEVGGRAVVLAGDTVPCDGLDVLCRDADVLVHTVTRDDVLRTIPTPRVQEIRGYHSSVEQAAQTAARAGVDVLVLTHYVPEMAPGTEDAWREQAAAHFGGRIELGDDLLSVQIP
jgi:ribonuclease Z